MSAHYTLPTDAVWFITGCSSGIGQTLATYIASTTTNRVIATARNSSSLSFIPSTPNVLKLTLDVTSQISIQTALTTSLQHFGRIDIFINNAGYGLMGDTEAVSDSDARAQMDTNFWGAVDITKTALPILREENPKTGQKGGVIIQVTSLGGRLAFPGNAFYHASKFALEGFTEAVSKELPADWNIHFCLIEPGGVKTNYATTSLASIAPHPAYTDPKLPTNVLRAYKSSPEAMKNWADPKVVVERLYEVVRDGVEGCNGGKGGIPFRLPLGSDSWGMQRLAMEEGLKEFGVLEGTSLSISGKEQMESIKFLRK
ncbi:short-chain dehydrogenase/reductase-like protein SDR [Zopfia rhizophila CBS 207.26]|uniref:Short-chain dehydrogenase/reductase-like protein SDR n=1 Tax=Zopfia rhizophila CBS 207.26 TaxID=1314779 RepID=A0A6A6ENP5_9PEZI|nr:short-chain dehydrogenase/reductase-like protein SDR [Zopfia rhizophila CBS 207.26]